MADANTTRYGLVKPEVGASADSWGGKLNNDMDDVDVLLGAITTTGSANAYVLTSGLSLAAYVSGQSFLIKASFTNSGAATINVDGLGAKSLVKGVSTALASGDMVSGAFYRVSYDNTNFIVQNSGGISQPLDATLTALAALSWSSGNALVQFTAADTVSLTLAPSVTSVTATNAGTAATLINNTDNANNIVLRLDSDRATPTNGDTAYVDVRMSDSAGNQDLFFRMGITASDVASGSEDANLNFSLMKAGTNTALMLLSGSGSLLAPNSNDGLALGSTSLGWSDLFLASGGVINWNNGGVTLTHDNTNDCLEVAGGGFAAPLEASTETTGTLTVASRNRVVNCSGGVTLDDGVFATNDWQLFDAGASARTFTRAAGLTMYVNGTDSASATLAANQMGGAYWRSATVVVLSGAFT